MFNPLTIKQQFPVLHQRTPLGEDLVYLDNAATCHKPQSVIDAITNFYAKGYSTVGRASYWPSSETTVEFNEVRNLATGFLNAGSQDEIVFNFGTTDGINKIANTFLRPRLNAGDQVIVSEMEHHANLLPWQQLCIEKGAELKIIPMTPSGDLDFDAFADLLNDKVKFIAITAVSNALGVKNDLKRVCEMAHGHSIPVFIDAAQSVSHDKVDVQDMDCDFLVFSGHKLYGPTGVGVLFAKKKWLDEMKPLSYGGGIVKEVGLQETTFVDGTARHEGGTPNIAGVIGLGAAIRFIESVGMDDIHKYLLELTNYAKAKLNELEGVTVLGNPVHQAPALSFVMEGVHPHDLSTFLNEKGICIRAGHHCAQPLMKKLKVAATTRVSLAIYNTKADIDKLIEVLKETQAFLS